MYDLPLARRTSEVRGENARRSGQTELRSIGLGISGGSGDGVLSYQGQDYPLAISGINIADVGVSQFQGAGKVYDLKNGADFLRSYAAAQAALVCSADRILYPCAMNAWGVTVVVLRDQGKESGTRFSLAPSGITLTYDYPAEKRRIEGSTVKRNPPLPVTRFASSAQHYQLVICPSAFGQRFLLKFS